MEMTPVAVQAIAGLLERATGQQLLAGRHWRLETELKPLLKRHGLSNLTALAARVSGQGEEALATEVVEALINHETSFYRDPDAFRSFADVGLAVMRARRALPKRLRIWSAGCATGQELYSLAMAFAGDPSRWAEWDVTLLGTDVSQGAIDRARSGRFSHFEVQRGLPITALIRHFDQEPDNGWRIKPELRQTVCFERHNLLDPAPGDGGFDIILCRNVLLYFAPERQREVLARLRAALAPDGLLMLGAGETMPDSSFSIDPTLKGLYRPAP